MTAANERWRKLEERGLGEFRRFLIMFAYLWAVVALFLPQRSTRSSSRLLSRSIQ